jgi:Na+/H+ antiporter NhaD/arsenite permease-like protein
MALGLAWALPFAGLLLSIALLPLLAPRFWHAHFGKVAAAWSVLMLTPYAWEFGAHATGAALAHAILLEYLPFVVLLFALYTVAGGLCIDVRLRATPLLNTALLALGALLASVMGTTGAAMLLIRPLLRANARRATRTHLVVFFIFLVANVGGALSPLGDPPLFLGFLNGVPFFWTTDALLWPTLLLAGGLLLAFFLLDAWIARARPAARNGQEVPEVPEVPEANKSQEPHRPLIGSVNLVTLAALIAVVLASGLWKPGIRFSILDTSVELQNLVRDLLLLLLSALSYRVTPREAYRLNAFHWGPIIEVAKLFLGIFVTIVPVIAILQDGDAGALAGLTRLVTRADGAPHEARYFWLTGGLSAFLDNAPTYLVFYNLAGGDAATLVAQRTVLAAISSGAVFMGALTYIGNAPNFMVKAIAEDAGVTMPSFFGYMAWSATLLLPLLVGIAVLFFP